MTDAAEMVHVERLVVRYDDPPARALDGVDLRQRRGEMVALLGASGAGKSTLLKCLNRLVPELRRADMEGEVRVLGRPTHGLAVGDLAGEIGFVFQDFEAQLFSTSVLEELVFGLEQLGVAPALMAGRVSSALAAVGLAGFERRDPTTLSGGEKQRLAIAAVLALEPALWLLDEPSTDLDPAGSREVFDILANLRRGGVTLLVAEHDAGALLAADRWAVLDRGRIVLEASPAELVKRPQALLALGVRPPELAHVCHALGLPAWPLDPETVAGAIRGGGLRLRAAAAGVAADDGTPAIEARGLRLRYPDAAGAALDGVDLTIRTGELVAIVGSNGSGKSTLAKILTGLLDASEGTVRFAGRPLESLSPAERAAAVGYVFQNPDEQLFAATVEEEIAFGPRQIGLAAAEIERRVRRVVAEVGLEGLENRDPFLLGKGERQKVAVASILALEPAVLVLDEPTTGLDHREQTVLLDLLVRINRSGRAVILITHVPWLVATYARRVVALADGRVVFDGSPRGLVADRDACRRADFVPNESARLALCLDDVALTADELLERLS